MADLNLKAIISVLDQTGGAATAAANIDRATASIERNIQTANRLALGSAAVGASMLGLSRYALNMSVDFKRAEIGFSTMLGSANKAKTFISELKDFAAATPFDFPQVQRGAQMMLAFGYNARSVIPTLRTLGDTAAAMGGDPAILDRILLQMGQMKASGKVLGQELRVMAQSGVPGLQILQEELGLTSQQMRRIGEVGISSDVGIPALMRGMEKRFGGMMEKVNKEGLNALSNLREQVSYLAADLGEGILPAFTTAVDRTRALVQQFNRLSRETKATIGTIMGGGGLLFGLAAVALKGYTMVLQMQAYRAQIRMATGEALALRAALPAGPLGVGVGAGAGAAAAGAAGAGGGWLPRLLGRGGQAAAGAAAVGFRPGGPIAGMPQAMRYAGGLGTIGEATGAAGARAVSFVPARSFGAGGRGATALMDIGEATGAAGAVTAQAGTRAASLGGRALGAASRYAGPVGIGLQVGAGAMEVVSVLDAKKAYDEQPEWFRKAMQEAWDAADKSTRAKVVYSGGLGGKNWMKMAEELGVSTKPRSDADKGFAGNLARGYLKGAEEKRVVAMQERFETTQGGIRRGGALIGLWQKEAEMLERKGMVTEAEAARTGGLARAYAQQETALGNLIQQYDQQIAKAVAAGNTKEATALQTKREIADEERLALAYERDAQAIDSKTAALQRLTEQQEEQERMASAEVSLLKAMAERGLASPMDVQASEQRASQYSMYLAQQRGGWGTAEGMMTMQRALEYGIPAGGYAPAQFGGGGRGGAAGPAGLRGEVTVVLQYPDGRQVRQIVHDETRAIVHARG